ncbi:hypothetical protein D3C78_1305620 [compost metagenome]
MLHGRGEGRDGVGGDRRFHRQRFGGLAGEELGVEQVAASRQGLDDLALFLVPQHLAQGVDLLVQAAGTDDAVGPGVGQQFFPWHHLAGGMEQAFQQAAAGESEVDLFFTFVTDQVQTIKRRIEACMTAGVARSDFQVGDGGPGFTERLDVLHAGHVALQLRSLLVVEIPDWASLLSKGQHFGVRKMLLQVLFST